MTQVELLNLLYLLIHLILMALYFIFQLCAEIFRQYRNRGH